MLDRPRTAADRPAPSSARSPVVTPTARPAPPAAASAAPPLAAVAALARLLAAAPPLDPPLDRVVRALRDTLGAGACSLWSAEAGPLRREAGDGACSARDVERAIDGDPGADRGGPALHALPLEADGLVIGALAVESDAPLDAERLAAAAVAADILAAALAGTRRRRELEEALATRTREIEEQRRFIELTIDSLPMGVYVIDRDYRIQLWNRKRETGLQGVSRDEAVGKPIFEILHRQPAGMLRTEFEDVFRTGDVQHFSMESSSTGELRYYRITKIPMRAEGAEVTHVITIGEDVTEWRLAQERFAQAEKLAAIGQLAAGVMHEINNPLATIGACAESLALALDDARAGGSAIPPQSGEYLRIVESEVHRSKRIVDRLLEFSRPKPLAPEPVDLNAVVEETLFLLKHHSRFKKFEVRTDLAEPPPVARGNAEQLVQVLMALLLNAMDASAEPGEIHVRTEAPRGARHVLLEVRDGGHGIPRSQLTKVFEPFYTTKAPGRGTGLGLSICYGIVAEHGGRLEAESTEGEGSVFRVLLPPGIA